MRKLFTAAIFLVACGPKPVLYNEGPSAYGANGLSAPAVYTVAPRAPRSMGSPAISMAEVPVNQLPILPSLDAPVGGNPEFPNRAFREPLARGLNPDLTDSRPLTVGGLDPRLPLPVEQKVYSGVFDEFGADEPYRHLDGDTVAIRVVEHPEFNGDAKIERDGRLKIPGTENYVAARDKTAPQIAAEVAREIRPYVRRFPEVRVITESATGGFYYVLGGVKNQGKFPIGMQPLTLSEAIFRANSELLEPRSLDREANAKARENYDLADNAALERVLLITPHRTAPRAEMHNVAAAIYGGVGGENPPVKNGQIIVVGESDNLRLEEYIRQALARANQHAPKLKTYNPAAPHLDSPLLNAYAEPQ